jgi:hypothetical protein
MHTPQKRPVPELARLLALSIDLHAQGKKQQALGLLGGVADTLTAGRPVRRLDLFAAACLCGLLTAHGFPETKAAEEAVVSRAAGLALALASALDESGGR